jgi:hypothetical protein
MRGWLISMLLVLTVWAAPASAWNSFGHFEVAALAWDKLTPKVRARVGELLKLNPMYETWVEGIEPQGKARFAFIRASNWPDLIRVAPDYQNDGAALGNRPSPGSRASQNIGYADHFRHRYWHFIDLPFSPDGTALEDPANPNIQTTIATMRSALADQHTSEDIKSYDLVWLIHLVGDAHQPLHCTSRFTHAHPHGDNGGNLVKIDCGQGCSAPNLHAFWDDVLGPSGAVPRVSVEAATKLEPPPSDLAAVTNEAEWVRESLEVAKASVYTAPIDEGPGPFALTDRYKEMAHTVAEQRIALAGARLANLLNMALK